MERALRLHAVQRDPHGGAFMSALDAMLAELTAPAKVPAFTLDNWRSAASFMLNGGFIGKMQHRCMMDAAKGEEGEHFQALFVTYANRVDAMPSTGQTDGQGDAAVAHLRYFAGGRAVCYITERDKGVPGEPAEERQSQAFGLSDLFGDGGELGYISLPEWFGSRAELDLYWQPKTIGAIKGGVS